MQDQSAIEPQPFPPDRFIAEAPIATRKGRSEFVDRLQRSLGGESLPPPRPLLGPLRHYDEALQALFAQPQLRMKLDLYPEVHDMLAERLLTAIVAHWQNLQAEVDQRMQAGENLHQQIEQTDPGTWMPHNQAMLDQLGRAYGTTSFDTQFYQQQFQNLDDREKTLAEQIQEEQHRQALLEALAQQRADQQADESPDETAAAIPENADTGDPLPGSNPEEAQDVPQTGQPTLEQLLAAQQQLEDQRRALGKQMLEDWAKANEELREQAYAAGAARGMAAQLAHEEAYLNAYGNVSEALRPLFKHFPSHGWDLAAAQWGRTNLAHLEKYARQLEQNPALQELAELLGRLQASKKELKDEARVEEITRYEPKIKAAAKAEFVGVETGNDLSLILPTELAALRHPVRKKDFMKRYADRQLQQFRVQDRYLATRTQTRLRTDPIEVDKNEKGPFVICVDTSGSMAGFPEQIAKTICFAILKIALEEKREVYLISFSTQIKCIELTKGLKSLPQLVEFLAHSFHGGTDADVALQAGIRKMSEAAWNKADLLIISDFIFPHLDPEVRRGMKRLRDEFACRFFALLVNVPEHGNTQAMAEFDRAWTYHADKNKPLREFTEPMQELKRR